MAKRKSLSKSVRFEVFKRDNFTCQYCGAAAPDVVLHVDHINPVAGGGENDIMNLITSCEPCNAGKGARELSDKSVIAKQRQQLADLNERREQLEVMLKWREGLASVDDDYIAAFADKFNAATRTARINDHGRSIIRKWLKRHSLTELLDALDDALGTYYKDGDADDNERDHALASKAFEMVPRIIGARKRNADKPWMKDLFYIRAIIRNRMYCNERVAIDLLEQAYSLGAPTIDMQDWAKRAKNWTNWRAEMETWIEELEAGQ